jgi:hypothetical protein
MGTRSIVAARPATRNVAYGHHYERLVELKREYDLENVLRNNPNIALGVATTALGDLLPRGNREPSER